MPQVTLVSTIKASAPRVWDLVGDFNAMPKWHPAVAQSTIEQEGGATVRRLTLVNGAVIRERLEEKNEAERYYRYTILEGPLPVKNYFSALTIRPAHDTATCTVEWTGRFEAAGVPDTDAERVIRDIYQAGIDNIKRIFGG